MSMQMIFNYEEEEQELAPSTILILHQIPDETPEQMNSIRLVRYRTCSSVFVFVDDVI